MEIQKANFFRVPPEVFYGIGAAEKVGELSKAFGKKAFLVSDPGISQTGMLDDVKRRLESAGIEPFVFSEVEPDPSVETVNKGLEAFKNSRSEFIVAVGGGSPMDIGKAVAMLATNGGKITDYEGVNKVKKLALPVVAIPTTAGTGSEVTINLVVIDHSRRSKFPVIDKNIAARMAIIDPVMTLTLPPRITAATGLDALTHAIESYTCSVTHPVSEVLALESIRLMGANLRQAVHNGRNLEFRDKMMTGCLMASMAFSNTRLGNVHAATNPICGYFGVPHGVANAIFLPHVMKFNVLGDPKKFADIAEALGEDIHGCTELEAAHKAVAVMKQLLSDSGLPQTLREVGVKEDAFESMAKETMTSGNILVNPRTTTFKDIMNLYKEAF